MKQNREINPFGINFDLHSGKGTEKAAMKRYLRDMKGMYGDGQAFAQMTETENPLVYEFSELDLPATEGDLLFGTSITYSGKVGEEYFMTKGHFHAILATAEVYYCLSGQGLLLMENPEGQWDAQTLLPGRAVYVPQRFAHRTINTGLTPLVTFFVFRADAGHDYGTIETRGFRKLVIEHNGRVEIVDNPAWHE